MIHVVHVVKAWGGGATRATCAAAKYLRRTGRFRHTYVALTDFGFERGRGLAADAGLRIVKAPGRDALRAELEAADVVQVEWWNNSSVERFLRSDLPPLRLVVFVHVAGDVFPSLLRRELVDFADFCVAGCRYAYERPAFQSLAAAERSRKTAVVPATCDFERLRGLEPRAHCGFQVGYVGQVDRRKMHPDFVAMSARVRVPGVRFLVCGRGEVEALERQAASLGAADRFELRGWVEDVRGVFEVLDVFGYPVGINTGSELSLHEALYAGVPPVVFARGGIGDVVRHGFNGLVAGDGREYAEAIEHLYHHPEERRRLAANARSFARRELGGERSAARLAEVYEKVMELPKRRRSWPQAIGSPAPEDEGTAGARLWIGSLGEAGEPFRRSLEAREEAAALAAEEEIAGVSKFGLWSLREYAHFHPRDRYLPLWQGLVAERHGDAEAAGRHYACAVDNGLTHPRIRAYLARATAAAGRVRGLRAPGRP